MKRHLKRLSIWVFVHIMGCISNWNPTNLVIFFCLKLPKIVRFCIFTFCACGDHLCNQKLGPWFVQWSLCFNWQNFGLLFFFVFFILYCFALYWFCVVSYFIVLFLYFFILLEILFCTLFHGIIYGTLAVLL